MKTKPTTRKLTLKKETLRDLTARNAGEVKGAGGTACCGSYLPNSCISVKPFNCNGRTHNKKC